MALRLNLHKPLDARAVVYFISTRDSVEDYARKILETLRSRSSLVMGPTADNRIEIIPYEVLAMHIIEISEATK